MILFNPAVATDCHTEKYKKFSFVLLVKENAMKISLYEEDNMETFRRGIIDFDGSNSDLLVKRFVSGFETSNCIILNTFN